MAVAAPDGAFDKYGITGGITLALCCKCSFYGMKDQWIKCVDSRVFRCPLCGCRHTAHLTDGGSILKVLNIMHPHTGITMCFPCRSLQFEEDCWLNKMAELHAIDIQTGEDLDAFLLKSARRLSDFLDRAVPMGFKLLDWNSEMEHRLDSTKFPKTNWAHFKDNGVRGLTMPSDVADCDELISLLANLVEEAKKIVSKR